jgi:uncharacterized membrane protein
MLNNIQLLPGAVAAILADTAETGVLTESDRYGLLAAVLDEQLSEEERRAINRILRAVRRGQVDLAA